MYRTVNDIFLIYGTTSHVTYVTHKICQLREYYNLIGAATIVAVAQLLYKEIDQTGCARLLYTFTQDGYIYQKVGLHTGPYYKQHPILVSRGQIAIFSSPDPFPCPHIKEKADLVMRDQYNTNYNHISCYYNYISPHCYLTFINSSTIAASLGISVSSSQTSSFFCTD